MFRPFKKFGTRPETSVRDWEDNIDRVVLEECEPTDDPLGWRVKYYVQDHVVTAQKTFVVGASYLNQRAENLAKAGYKASMTALALKMLEQQTGQVLNSAAA